jgi:hypothetical protein
MHSAIFPPSFLSVGVLGYFESSGANFLAIPKDIHKLVPIQGTINPRPV